VDDDRSLSNTVKTYNKLAYDIPKSTKKSGAQDSKPYVFLAVYNPEKLWKAQSAELIGWCDGSW
jgi:hypothetical protein